ncbi:MAG: Rid family detoxifying hydrolase [Gammaproteobacteria bacterium]|jgi:reactive intermediate/imine deaminase|nr:Rid family detoxifying hydrolase [Gammaproteobacteria bacterium]
MSSFDRRPVFSPEAPAPLGVYSPGLRLGSWLFLSGQIGLEPGSGTLPEGSFEEEVRRVFAHLEALCRAEGAGRSDIVRLGVFLTDLAHYGTFNAVMEELFVPPYPARTVVAVAALPRGARLEVDAIVSVRGDA